MNWTSGIQAALDYIEEHLTDELDINAIAAQAACSGFYFQRIFGILCGLTLGEYIRYRRMTCAGEELSAGGAKVIDVALKYGYDSPESFSRAFMRFHGITPSEAKKCPAGLRSFSPLSVQIILKGGNHMDYKIIEQDSFYVLERIGSFSTDDSENSVGIPAFWDRCRADGTLDRLLTHSKDQLLYGICYGSASTDPDSFVYGIGVIPTDDLREAPEGFRLNCIPARSWAEFSCTGAMPQAIQRLWHQICGEFFPASGWQPTFEYDIEIYPKGDMSSEAYKSGIRVAVHRGMN